MRKCNIFLDLLRIPLTFLPSSVIMAKDKLQIRQNNVFLSFSEFFQKNKTKKGPFYLPATHTRTHTKKSKLYCFCGEI